MIYEILTIPVLPRLKVIRIRIPWHMV